MLSLYQALVDNFSFLRYFLEVLYIYYAQKETCGYVVVDSWFTWRATELKCLF